MIRDRLLMIWLLDKYGNIVGGLVLTSIAALSDLFIIYTRQTLEPYNSNSLLSAIIITLHFSICFTIGAVLFRSVSVYRPIIGRFGTFSQLGLLAFSATLLQVRRDIMLDVGAGALVAVVVSAPRLSTILEGWVPQFLGRISFSLYLLHLPILLSLTYCLYGSISQELIFVLTFILSIGIANISYYYIEMPLISVGRTLAKKMAKT